MSLDGKSGGVRLRGLDDDSAKDVGYYMLWPNVLISPHPDYVMTHRIEPLTPNRTFVECQWLFAPESHERADFDPSFASDFWDVTNRQDWNACESVHRGSAGARLQAGAVLRARGPGVRVRPHGCSGLPRRRSSRAGAAFL